MTLQKRHAETKEQRAERLARASLRKQANDQRVRNQMIKAATLIVRTCRVDRAMIHARVTEYLSKNMV